MKIKDIKFLIRNIAHIKLKYLFYGSIVYVSKDSQLTNKGEIMNSVIRLYGNSRMNIGESIVENCDITLHDSTVTIGNGNYIGDKCTEKVWIKLNGTMSIGNDCSLRCKIWQRFGGLLNIANKTDINRRSFIRCDENISIGSYNMVSNEVMIWDTNTHVIIPCERRRNLKDMKISEFQNASPKTKPIVIGDDCWIGQSATIMKGTTIGDRCIVGYGTTLVGQHIEPNTTVVSDVRLKLSKNNI